MGELFAGLDYFNQTLKWTEMMSRIMVKSQDCNIFLCHHVRRVCRHGNSVKTVLPVWQWKSNKPDKTRLYLEPSPNRPTTSWWTSYRLETEQQTVTAHHLLLLLHSLYKGQHIMSYVWFTAARKTSGRATKADERDDHPAEIELLGLSICQFTTRRGASVGSSNTLHGSSSFWCS